MYIKISGVLENYVNKKINNSKISLSTAFSKILWLLYLINSLSSTYTCDTHLFSQTTIKPILFYNCSTHSNTNHQKSNQMLP